MNLKSTIEALLFVSDRPLTKKELAKLSKAKTNEVESALNELKDDCEKNNRGIVILINDDKVQIATSPEASAAIKEFLDFEVKEDLTPAAIETLSIISYRGPISKEDLDNIRGVNCSVILRHLLVKGLAEEKSEGDKKNYNLSFDFIRWLGLKGQSELPSYARFHNLEINLPTETLTQSNVISTDSNNSTGNPAN